MMMLRGKHALYILLTALSLSTLSAAAAYCQSVQPKLTIKDIGLYSAIAYGFYNAKVDLVLQRGNNNPTATFVLSIEHVRTLDELFAKLRPPVKQMAEELKAASDDFQPPH
jgi:hypothetical protein